MTGYIGFLHSNDATQTIINWLLSDEDTNTDFTELVKQSVRRNMDKLDAVADAQGAVRDEVDYLMNPGSTLTGAVGVGLLREIVDDYFNLVDWAAVAGAFIDDNEDEYLVDEEQ